MKVSTFYQNCTESSSIAILSGNRRHMILYKAIEEACEQIWKGQSVEDILSVLENSLVSGYQSEWFSFSWQMKQTIQDDIAKFRRFLKWLGRQKVLAANVPVTAAVSDTVILEDKVSLLVQYANGAYGAILLNTGKNKFSMSGKSTHTKAENNLHALVAKRCLEPKYPYITVTSVYLTSADDTLGHIKEAFVITKTKASNVTSLNFKDFYAKQGVISTVQDRIEEVFHTPIQKSCYGCQYEALCKMQALQQHEKISVKEDEASSSYVMPNFTDNQKKVVSHVAGPMLVCAGPGSGKTATLVGRIKSMIEKQKIDPDYILAITFTKEAAKELEKRISSFCGKDMPTVSTINALCYRILRENADIIGSRVNLLTQREKLSIIEGLLEAMPHIQGLSYEILDGNNGLLKTTERRLDKYQALRDREAFLNAYPDLSDDFCDLADNYLKILERNSYITFQEQISLCVKLLSEQPELLAGYSNLYRYIMVDEFQDIDSMQAKFIYMLASHQNLVVVGDDDQAIYGFRGGSQKYMLEFCKQFPTAEKVVLTENFRSTKAIVEASKEVIADNEQRIAKEVNAVREQGTAPVFLIGTGADSVEQAISEARSQGYGYGDIAILAKKNSTLETIKETMISPAVLEKSYLVNEPLFAAVYFSMLLFQSGMNNNHAMLYLMKLFGVTPVTRSNGNLYQALLDLGFSPIENNNFYQGSNTSPEYKMLAFLSDAYALRNVPASRYMQGVAFLLSLETTNSVCKLGELIRENRIVSTEDLLSFMDFMVRFEDDTKVDVSGQDAVLLVTNHESKGREFPVVILVDEATNSTTEEDRRVLYVAMTRAKDKLYVLKEKGQMSMLDVINK